MTPQAEKSTVVKSLAGAIQEKLVVPTEQRFQQTELRLTQLERRFWIFCGGLAATVVLALVLAVYGLFK
ncbi:MAG: hypothetical protein AB1556_01475 [Bacillota bacterium]